MDPESRPRRNRNLSLREARKSVHFEHAQTPEQLGSRCLRPEARIPSQHLLDEEWFPTKAETGWKYPAQGARAFPRSQGEQIRRRRVEHRLRRGRARMQAGGLPAGNAPPWSDRPQRDEMPPERKTLRRYGSARAVALLFEPPAHILLP